MIRRPFQIQKPKILKTKPLEMSRGQNFVQVFCDVSPSRLVNSRRRPRILLPSPSGSELSVSVYQSTRSHTQQGFCKPAVGTSNLGLHSLEKGKSKVKFVLERTTKAQKGGRGVLLLRRRINPLALQLDIYSLAHHLSKMWIFYEPRGVTLGDARNFVDE